MKSLRFASSAGALFSLQSPDAVETKRRLLAHEQGRLEKAKVGLLTLASRELETPLALVQGYTAILTDMSEAGRLDPEEGTLIIQRIIADARRLREVIENVLDTLAVQANTLDLEIKPTSLAEVIGLALRDLRPLISQRVCTIRVWGLERQPKIEGDAAQLRRALRSIITNSLQYTPDRGRISVQGRLLAAQPEQAAIEIAPGVSYIEVVVTDTGIGIAPADVAHFLDISRSVGDSARVVGLAMGKRLGGSELVLARGIIESHGGRMWVKSEGYGEKPYPGAEFHILLPVMGSPQAPFGQRAQL